jgi:anti-anti-sigma regulatory factor
MTGVSPPFTEAVDWARASIAARGPLTLQGADLIRGTAQVMRRGGLREITLDLHEVVLADTAALDLLRALVEELSTRDGRLVVLAEKEDRS